MPSRARRERAKAQAEASSKAPTRMSQTKKSAPKKAKPMEKHVRQGSPKDVEHEVFDPHPEEQQAAQEQAAQEQAAHVTTQVPRGASSEAVRELLDHDAEKQAAVLPKDAQTGEPILPSEIAPHVQAPPFGAPQQDTAHPGTPTTPPGPQHTTHSQPKGPAHANILGALVKLCERIQTDEMYAHNLKVRMAVIENGTDGPLSQLIDAIQQEDRV